MSNIVAMKIRQESKDNSSVWFKQGDSDNIRP